MTVGMSVCVYICVCVSVFLRVCVYVCVHVCDSACVEVRGPAVGDGYLHNMGSRDQTRLLGLAVSTHPTETVLQPLFLFLIVMLIVCVCGTEYGISTHEYSV